MIVFDDNGYNNSNGYNIDTIRLFILYMYMMNRWKITIFNK